MPSEEVFGAAEGFDEEVGEESCSKHDGPLRVEPVGQAVAVRGGRAFWGDVLGADGGCEEVVGAACVGALCSGVRKHGGEVGVVGLAFEEAAGVC